MLTAILVQTFHSALVIADYYSNTLAYAKNCENKAKPQMHCNGKCQMMKKIQQEEKKEQNNPERKADNKNETTFYADADFVFLIRTVFIITRNKPVPVIAAFIPCDYRKDIFHPPHL
jgi:hypothetical protein